MTKNPFFFATKEWVEFKDSSLGIDNPVALNHLDDFPQYRTEREMKEYLDGMSVEEGNSLLGFKDKERGLNRRIYHRNYSRKKSYRLSMAGLCIKCGVKPRGENKMCIGCREKQREACRNSIKKKRLEAKEKGLCLSCFKIPRGKKRFCDICREKHNKSVREYVKNKSRRLAEAYG